MFGGGYTISLDNQDALLKYQIFAKQYRLEEFLQFHCANEYIAHGICFVLLV